MKSLKIKSYLIGFILVLISIFSFNNKAIALETKNFYFDSENYISSNRDLLDNYGLIDKFNDLFDYLDINSNYEYLFSLGINKIGEDDFLNIRLYLIKDISKVTLFQVVGDNYPEIRVGNSDYMYIDTVDSFNINLSDTNFDEFFENFKLNFDKKNNNPNWWKLYYMNTFLYVDENNYIKNDNTFFLKSSFDVNLSLNDTKTNNNIIFDNGFVLEEGVSLQEFLKEINYFNVSKINLSKTYANDLEGNDLYNIRADFEDIYDESYTYQFKTDNFNDWVDITGNIKTAVQEGYYIYDFSCYYNTNVIFRVLDSSGEVIDENSINVSELNDFKMEIYHNPANDLQGRYVNAVTVNLHNCWSDSYKYQYSFDKETFYNMEINNKQFILNHGIQTFLYFRILDENNNVIYTHDYEVIFNGLLKSVNIDEDVRTDENNEKFIIANISFKEFSEFSDTYNLKYYLNDIELEETNDLYVYEWNKEQYYSFKGVEIVVKIDNFVVYSAFYLPSMGDKTFEDKYDDVVEDNLEEELGDNDYSDVNGMLEAVKSFINAIKNFINAFFSLILVFFNRLNIWIKSMIIGLFIVMVICRIIKAVRK